MEDLTAFTASINHENLSPGRYVHELLLYLRAEASAGDAITPTELLPLINPFEIFLKGSPVIQINAEDLFALDALAFGFMPPFYESDAVTDDGSWVSLKIPLWQPPRASGELKYRVTRVGQASIDTETLSLTEWNSTNPKPLNPKYLQYVTLAGTSAGATGFGNRVEFGRTIGELEGVLIRSATLPTDTTETATVDNIDVYANEVKIISETWQTMKGMGKIGHIGTISLDADDVTHNQIIDNYVWLDLTEDPIKRGTNVRIDIDTQATSTAFRLTPVYAI